MKSTYLIRLFLPLMLIFCAGTLAACSCGMEEWNDATFERYDFIAHVKVKGVDQMNGPFDQNTFSWEGAMLYIEILELYRGEKEKVVYAIDYNSSCGVSVEVGEEWVLFANTNRSGGLFMHGCSPSTDYRDKDGKKMLWSYPNKIKHWVDTTCQVTLPGLAYSGVESFQAYYANDQLEERTEYLNGEKHGRSVHYYPDGVLMDERYYREGKPTGKRRYYEPDGSPNFELEYNFQGELVRETNYLKGYDNLRHEILYVPETGQEKDFAFRANGSLASLTISQDWRTLIEKYFDNDGRLIHHLEYDDEREEAVLLDSLGQK